MRYSSDGTEHSHDRLFRGLAAVLLVVAAVSLTAAWALHARTVDQLAALRGDNPADQIVLAPVAYVSHDSVAPSASGTAPTPARSITPTHLYAKAIGVDTSVAAKPTKRAHDPFLNRTVDSFGVPDDMYTTTWWSSGPKPGSGQLAVILGHTQIGGYGVFNKLASLRRGDPLLLTGAGGAALKFSVEKVRTGISKTDPYALRTALTEHPAGAALALITCSGTFDTDFDQSAENTVVFATLS